jgi:HSP20 family protein
MAIIRFGEDPFFSSPFEEMRKLRAEMNRLFNSFFGQEPAVPAAGVFPPLNVSEDESTLYVRAELPGVEAKKLDISVVGRTLTILGERNVTPQGPRVSYHRRERESGTFRRSVSLPVPIDVEQVSAESKEGVLTIALPKAQEAKPKKIEIKA